MFLTVSGRWKSKIKVPEEAVCDENSLCGLWTVSFSWCPHMAQGEHCESELVLFLGAPPSWPNHFPMAPTLFRMLSLWRVGFQHMSVGGHKHSIHLTTSNSSSLDSYPGCIRESCWICPYYIVAVSISFLSLFNTFFSVQNTQLRCFKLLLCIHHCSGHFHIHYHTHSSVWACLLNYHKIQLYKMMILIWDLFQRNSFLLTQVTYDLRIPNILWWKNDQCYWKIMQDLRYFYNYLVPWASLPVGLLCNSLCRRWWSSWRKLPSELELSFMSQTLKVLFRTNLWLQLFFPW